eukprot:jgi/Orpsp1_1/1188059/evm.model.d7180000062209.1
MKLITTLSLFGLAIIGSNAMSETVTIRRTITLVKPRPTNESTCFSIKLGYDCCNSCDVYYTNEDGQWGYENGEWCGIKPSCNTTKNINECWSEKLGHPCCQNTSEIKFTDENGNWGIEN